jgi:hypothetical protein
MGYRTFVTLRSSSVGTPVLHFEKVYFRLILNHYLHITHDYHYTSLYNIWNVYDEAFVEDGIVGQSSGLRAMIMHLITIGKAITDQ